MPRKKQIIDKTAEFEKNSKYLLKIFKERPFIIGMDLSTTSTGFYDKNSEGIGVAFIPKSSNRIARVSNIKHNISERLRSIGEDNCIAIIEDYSLGVTHPTSLSQLAELGGVIRVLLFESGIPYLLVTPQTLKKFVLGGKERGKNANKKALILVEVLYRWGIKFNNDDIADAFCLFQFGKALYRYLLNPDVKKKWEQEMFKKFVIDRGAKQ